MSNLTRFLPLALAVASFLPACKTQRTERWEQGRTSDPLSARFVGESMDRWNSGQQHSMDRQRVKTEDVFGGDRGNQQFGGEKFRRKPFARSGEKFAGNKEYRRDSYQFVRDREMAREAAAAADKQFVGGDESATEGRKRWFGRDKSFETKAAYGSDKSVGRPALREAEKAQELNRKRDLDIINPDGSEAAPKGLSVQQVRTLLGK